MPAGETESSSVHTTLDPHDAMSCTCAATPLIVVAVIPPACAVQVMPSALRKNVGMPLPKGLMQASQHGPSASCVHVSPISCPYAAPTSVDKLVDVDHVVPSGDVNTGNVPALFCDWIATTCFPLDLM